MKQSNDMAHFMQINLTGPFKAARAAIKIMETQENGGTAG